MERAPGPASGGGASRVACCCGLGCVFVVALLAGLSWLGWVRVGRPLQESITDMAAAREETAAAEADLARLDRQSPPAEVEDASARDLSAADVDRYVAVRQALAAPLSGVASAWEGLVSELAPAGDGHELREILGTALGAVQGSARLASARRDLLVAAVAVLEREGLGPTEALAVAELVEWRFLGRAEALPLALPEWRRSEVWDLRLETAMLEAWAKGSVRVQVDGQDPERALADGRQRLAEIEREAEQRRELSPTTRAALEARRAELVALGDGAPGLAWLGLPSSVGLNQSVR